uniref:Genome assembly, chromosome: II n=1 Tax=Steinernema glaseri TaxID=37863 RepID=A0A1I7YQJ9_9BILA
MALLLLLGAVGAAAGHAPYFTPCTFPSPLYFPEAYKASCTLFPNLPFICDLHQQLSQSGSSVVLDAFLRHRDLFFVNNSYTLGVVLVKSLQSPPSVDQVFGRPEYQCLFDDNCLRMDAERVENFVQSVRTFTKVYVSVLYDRWFVSDVARPQCQSPNILALIVLDGLLNDPRKLSSVTLHSGEDRLTAMLLNIQQESTNAILQGWPLHQVIGDLVDQLGSKLRDFHRTGLAHKAHIPRWAYHLGLGCLLLLLASVLAEWYIVRRKLAVKKSPPGVKLTGARSKTHLMF